MNRRRLVIVVAVLLGIGLAGWLAHRRSGEPFLTGFVEGEERIIRAEVPGRVVDILFHEGDALPAGAVLARLDDADVAARLEAKAREIAMLDAEVARQRERVTVTRETWERDLNARRAELRQAEAASARAARTFAREAELVKLGASTSQRLDDERANRDQTASMLDRARQLVGRAEAEERTIALAERELTAAAEKRKLAEAQRVELEVTHAKYVIHAPGVPTVVQTQLLWAGELAQPGTPVASLIDPADKYVLVYVPVPDVARFRVGRRVTIELDSAPGTRVPGEVSFVADSASFTPEKIETRDERVGQVYRAKVRILEGVERFQPGTEGNVYLGKEPAP